MSTKCAARIVVPCASKDEAERVRRALEPDNEGFLRVTVRGRDLVLEVDEAPLGSVVATVDDALAGVRVALGAGGDEEE